MSKKSPITLKKFTEAEKQAEYDKMIEKLLSIYISGDTSLIRIDPILMERGKIIEHASDYILNEAPKNLDLQDFMIKKFDEDYKEESMTSMEEYIRRKNAIDEEGALGGGKRRRRSKRRRRRPSTKKRVARKSRRTKSRRAKSRRSKTRRRSKRRSRRN